MLVSRIHLFSQNLMQTLHLLDFNFLVFGPYKTQQCSTEYLQRTPEMQFKIYTFYIGGSKGARGTVPPSPNSLNFMQFLGKFGKIVCWRTPPRVDASQLGEILDPPLC